MVTSTLLIGDCRGDVYTATVTVVIVCVFVVINTVAKEVSGYE